MARSLDAAKPSITILAGVALLGVVLSLARIVLIPIALSILLTFTLSPAVLALQRRKISRTIAVLLVMGTSIFLISSVLSALSWQLYTLASNLPDHKENIIRKIRQAQGDGPGILERLARLMEDVTAGVKSPDERVDNSIPVPIKEQPKNSKEQPKNSLVALRETAGSVVGMVGTVGLIIAMTMAMLFKREDLRNRLIRLAGHGELTSTTRAIDEATRRISRYLLIQLSVNASFGFIYGVGLFFIGVPYALLWGFLAFLVRFIPFIGTWLAGLLPLVFSFATSETWFQPIAVVVFTLTLGILVNNVVEPLLVSRSTGVSPVGLVIAAAFWTWLWGPIGLVLSTPITVCLAVLGRFVPSLQFLDILFGTDPALDPQEGYYQRLLARDEVEAGEILDTFLEENGRAELCDRLLLPTLVRAKEDMNLGNLTAEDLTYIVSATKELLSDVGVDAELESAGATQTPTHLIIGCPAKDRVDELGLHLFQQLFAATLQVRIVSVKMVAGELIELIRTEKPAAALVSAIHPGGLAKIRYLIKRLRGSFPELQIDVGYWGLPLSETKLPLQLKKLGASQVATSMNESVEQMESFLRAYPHVKQQVVDTKAAANADEASRLPPPPTVTSVKV